METEGLPPATRRDALLDLVPAIIDKYGDMANDAAAEWYERMRAKWFGRESVQCLMAEPAGGDGMRRILRSRMGLLWKDDGAGDEELLRYLNQTIDRNVREPARQTILRTSEHDPRKPKYARVPQGPTCAFCIMLAGRGWDYKSAEAAGAGKFNEFHAECDCEIVPSWDEHPHVDGYDPEGINQRYLQCRSAIEHDLDERYKRERKLYYDDEGNAYQETESDFEERAVLEEMRRRTHEWLYDGTCPPPTYESERAKKELKPHEKRTIQVLSENGFAVYVPQRSQVQGVKTADTIINGVTVEMKAPEGNTGNTIDGVLRRAAKQGNAAIVDLQKGRTTIDSGQCLQDIQRALRRRHVEYVLFIDYDNTLKRITKAVPESQ